jgi:predicted RNA-binding protein with RPS1 domain
MDELRRRLDDCEDKVVTGPTPVQEQTKKAADQAVFIGDSFTGVVERVGKHGAHLSLIGTGGVWGWLHVSEMSDRFVANAAAVLTVGREMEVTVIEITAKGISLGRCELAPGTNVVDARTMAVAADAVKERAERFEHEARRAGYTDVWYVPDGIRKSINRQLDEKAREDKKARKAGVRERAQAKAARVKATKAEAKKAKAAKKAKKGKGRK